MIKYLIFTFSIVSNYCFAQLQPLPNLTSSSVVASNGYYLFSQINTTSTLTTTSPEYLLCFGNITLTLPSAASAYTNGQGRKFYFYKGDGITTLTVNNSTGSTLWSATNYTSTASFISNGTSWFQIQ